MLRLFAPRATGDVGPYFALPPGELSPKVTERACRDVIWRFRRAGPVSAHRRASRLAGIVMPASRGTSSKSPRFIRHRRRFGDFPAFLCPGPPGLRLHQVRQVRKGLSPAPAHPPAAGAGVPGVRQGPINPISEKRLRLTTAVFFYGILRIARPTGCSAVNAPQGRGLRPAHRSVAFGSGKTRPLQANCR